MPGAAEAFPPQPLARLVRFAAPVEPCSPSNREALRAFQREQFGRNSRQADDAWFHWAFARHPLRQHSEPLVWLCNRDGVVVGQQARLPASLKLGETEHRAYWGVDLMVDPAWRLRGVGPSLFAEYGKSEGVLLGLGLADAMVRTCLRSGWTDLGFLGIYARPIDVAACARAIGKHQWLNQMPGFVGRASAQGFAIIAKSRGYVLDQIQSFDARMNAVWTHASRFHEAIVRRDYEALRWRYDLAPDHARYRRFYLMRRGEVLGFAVLRADDWRGLPVLRVIDFLCLPGDSPSLFALVVNAARLEGAVAVIVEALAPDDGLKSLRRVGFAQMGAATRLMARIPDSLQHYRDPLRWFVTRGDSDSDFSLNA